MVRTLLISALLIAGSLACAPHSPRRSRPVTPPPPKECPAQTSRWEPTECKAELETGGKMYECTPFTATTTKFSCADGASPVVYGDTAKVLNSVTCDAATGKWNYDSDEVDDVLTDETIGKIAGTGPFKFACSKLIP